MTTDATETAEPTQPTSTAAERKSWAFVTFFEHIYSFLKDHLGSAASFEQSAATALTIIAPLGEQLVSEVAGTAVEAKVQAFVTQLTTDLNNTSALLNGAAATSADHSVAGYLTDAQNAIGTLLADADIKNSGKLAKITVIANTILGECKAIVAAIPAPKPAAPAA